MVVMYSVDKHVIAKLCVISFVFFRRFALHGPEPPFLVCMGEVGSGENIKKNVQYASFASKLIYQASRGGFHEE